MKRPKKYPLSKKCYFCGSLFVVKKPNQLSKKYCNHKCYVKTLFGIKQSEETKEKRRKALIGKKRPPFSDEWRNNIGKASTGRVWSEESRRAMAESRKGANSSFWRGGVDRKEYKHYKNVDYILWRERVFTRDKYTCRNCGIKSGCGHSVVLHPHHIKSYTHFPKLRYKVNNGMTLCVECHQNHHWKGV